jgi:diguanylate cyclase (GGDEF)-like protein
MGGEVSTNQPADELQRVKRALKTLRATNRALLRASDEVSLLNEICRVVVEDSGYRFAWVGYAEHDEQKTVRPMAHAGFEEGYLAIANITWADTERGRGPTGTAIRTGKPCVIRNMVTDASVAPWREEVIMRGYASAVALPLRVDQETIGVLNIRAGEPDAFDDEELNLLIETAEDLAYGIQTLRWKIEREQVEQTIRRMALYDVLTGLPNRVRLRDLLEQAIVAAKRQTQPLALLLIGAERFSEINETLGSQEGDKLLQAIARRLQSIVDDRERVGRMSEDQFAVLLPANDAERATRFAAKILAELHEPIELSGLMLDPRVSIGLTLFPGHGTDADALIRRAHVALHQAKRTASGYAVYAGSLDRDGTYRLALMADLVRAIDKDELVLYCQPKVDFRTGRVCGAEALVRWQHPQKGTINPGEFIKLAESAGLITPLTFWMLNAAVRQSYAWRAKGIDIPLAVNLSAQDLRDPKLLDRIKGSFTTWGAQADWIQFELTESALMEDPAGSLVTLGLLKDFGVALFIDDYGTGYSSLSYLQKLPVDAIKIDQSFVGDMIRSSDSATIVRSTIDLAHTLELKVVAEGVENRELWDSLASLGCDVAQGYYISAPIPSDEIAKWMTQSPWGMRNGVEMNGPSSGIAG